MKKILVTGGSGFVGSHLTKLLLKKKFKVTVLDIKKPKLKKINFIKSNLSNFTKLKKITKNIDMVFHLAGVSDITKVKSIPLETIKNNILFSSYLLEACRINNVKRFIFASSIYAHGQAGNLYTSSKIATEQIIKNFNLLYNLNYTILRYSTVYGTHNRGVDVITLFINKAKNNKNIKVHGNGLQTRDFVHAEDIANASLHAMNLKYKNKTLTIGQNKNIKIIDLARKIIKLSNSKSKIQKDKANKRQDDFDLNKLKKINKSQFINYKFKYSLEKGIKKLLS
tara:strand:+ start:5542 stop:6387 length:846 start_codon:yes stop_codon:yes gene_type:complete